MPNCVFCSECVIRCWSWVVCDSLPKLSWLQRISIRCWIGRSAANLWFAVEIKVACRELVFVAKLCVLQRNCDSLPKLYCLQRICDSLPKLSCLQLSSIRCRKTCWLQRTSFRCWNYGASSETVFAVELAASSEPFFIADFYNRPFRQKWLKC